MTRLSETVDGFMLARGYSGDSRRQRGTVVQGFIDCVGDIEPSAVTSGHVLTWWGTKSERAAATRRAYLTVIRLWWKHMMLLGHTTEDPTRLIALPRIPARPPVSLQVAEIQRVLSAAETQRDMAMLTLMLGCGLRGGDLQRLNIEDIDVERKILRVRVKGGDDKLKPVPAIAMMHTVKLMEELGESGPLIQAWGEASCTVSADGGAAYSGFSRVKVEVGTTRPQTRRAEVVITNEGAPYVTSADVECE